MRLGNILGNESHSVCMLESSLELVTFSVADRRESLIFNSLSSVSTKNVAEFPEWFTVILFRSLIAISFAIMFHAYFFFERLGYICLAGT